MTTFEDEVEVRRTSVGTKVLVFACAILAVLGSFWGIVWFIRAYVEPPRVMLPAPMALAAQENITPAAPAQSQPEPAKSAASVVSQAQASEAGSTPAATAAAPQSTPADAIADRWGPVNEIAARAAAPILSRPPPVATVTPTFNPVPVETTPAVPSGAQAPVSAPAALATANSDERPIEEVVEGSVAAIEGPAPLPRRKPIVTASTKRADPPLPRPRPDGPAPQSVWTAVPVSDDRFVAGQ